MDFIRFEACHFIGQFLVLTEEASLGFGEAENVKHLHQLLPIIICAAPHSSN